MAISVNRVILVGNLGSDPERKGKDGGFVTFNIATSKSWKDRDTGEKREKTEWHRVVVFNKIAADFAEKYVKKGDMVYLEGSLETRKWIDNEGVERYSTEVIVHPFEGVLQSMSRSGGGSRQEEPRQEERREPVRGGGYSGGGGFSRDLDDDIPFAPEWR